MSKHLVFSAATTLAQMIRRKEISSVELTQLFIDQIEPAVAKRMQKMLDPTHFTRNVMPQLLAAGVTQEQLDAIVVDNPRRFFSGEVLRPDLEPL